MEHDSCILSTCWSYGEHVQFLNVFVPILSLALDLD